MLKKENRLPSSAFGKIYARGRMQRGQYIILRQLQNYKPISRFGVSISTKIIKKATSRNKIKRQILEIIQQYYDKIAKGRDYIFTIKKELEFSQLEKEIKNLLNV